jgi:hypothetical protein
MMFQDIPSAACFVSSSSFSSDDPSIRRPEWLLMEDKDRLIRLDLFGGAMYRTWLFSEPFSSG